MRFLLLAVIPSKYTKKGVNYHFTATYMTVKTQKNHINLFNFWASSLKYICFLLRVSLPEMVYYPMALYVWGIKNACIASLHLKTPVKPYKHWFYWYHLAYVLFRVMKHRAGVMLCLLVYAILYHHFVSRPPNTNRLYILLLRSLNP